NPPPYSTTFPDPDDPNVVHLDIDPASNMTYIALQNRLQHLTNVSKFKAFAVRHYPSHTLLSISFTTVEETLQTLAKCRERGAKVGEYRVLKVRRAREI
ncbi:hypothetical protein HDV00_007336, partial [Rhizophlyctis rosea]